MPLEYTPYSTTVPWLRGLPSWMSEEDGARIEAYALYEMMYWSVPETFRLTQLGSEEDPIYIPNAKIIVEAILRFLCVKWDIKVSDEVGTPADQEKLRFEMTRLIKREKLKSKFMTQLRYCLIRGDALWHITADPEKEQGHRISIHELDPSSYFPITDIDNDDRIVGCHIVDQWLEGDKEYVRRQTYRKTERNTISSELALFEIDKWDDRNPFGENEIKLIRQLETLHDLPAQITQLPVYHWKNIRNASDPFGSSQLRGLERIFAAVNQTISDEDLAVALMGLGVYATDSNRPVDDQGNPVNWLIGPGRVVEVTPDTDFKRVDGVTTVEPSQNHIEYLEKKALAASSVPDIALGNVEVQAAESGVALAIKLLPLITSNEEKALEILGTTDQMLYDLTIMWFPGYEAMSFGEALAESATGDPIPQNRAGAVQEVVALATATPPLITIEEARARLNQLGYSLGEEGMQALVSQIQQTSSAADPFATRTNEELSS